MWNHSDWRRLQKIAPSSRKSFILPILALLLLLFLYTHNEFILALFTMVASTWILLPTLIDALNRYWHIFGILLS